MSLHKEPEWIFPFDSLKVGNSFFVPTLKPSEMIFAISNGAKRAGIKVRVFVTSKDGIMGVRCWRTR